MVYIDRGCLLYQLVDERQVGSCDVFYWLYEIRLACFCRGDLFKLQIYCLVLLFYPIKLLKLSTLKLFIYVVCRQRKWQADRVPTAIGIKSSVNFDVWNDLTRYVFVFNGL